MRRVDVPDADVADPRVCPACGGATAGRIEGRVQGMYCARCDVWSVVATYWSKEERDPATYAVRVLGADRTRAEHLRAVAAVSGWNWRTARDRLAADARPTIFCGTAVEARAARGSKR